MDPLTGLLNRRAFAAESGRALERCLRDKTPVCAIMMDMDHFKLINDARGHAVGDEVLKEAATRAQRELRAGDIACRYGGEEFAFFLPGTQLEEAGKAAERIRAAIAGTAILAAAVSDNRLLFESRQSNEALASSYDATLKAWVRMLELRDQETEGHSRRVTSMTMTLAKAMGIKPEGFDDLRRGALLHDIGKWDGSGYPRGLKGTEIPLGARIFAIVDVWDALCSDRPYWRAMPANEAAAVIAAGSGSHFDPLIAKTFLNLKTSEIGHSIQARPIQDSRTPGSRREGRKPIPASSDR